MPRSTRQLLAAAVSLIVLVLATRPAYAEVLEIGTIKPSLLNVRAGPGLESSRTAVLRSGTEVAIRDRSKDWLNIVLPDGSTGWVNASYVTSQEYITWQVATVNAQLLNIRKGPALDHPVLGVIPAGARLAVLACQREWCKVATADGRIGWVSLAYVDLAILPNVLPILSITGSAVNIRKAPGTDRPVVATLPQDTRLLELGRQGDWAMVRLPDGRTGWIAGWLVRPVSQVSVKTMATVAGDAVNVREGAGLSYPVMGVLSGGTTLQAVGYAAGWYQLRLADGRIGWTADYLLRVDYVPAGEDEPTRGGARPAVTSLAWDTPASGFLLRINANGPLQYTSYTLHSPERIVIDMNGTDLATSAYISAVNAGKVQRIRVAQCQADPPLTRVVIDLTEASNYLTRLSDNGNSLAVTLLEGSALPSRVIVIDPGHGGYHTGALGVRGTREKEPNLDISLRLARLLEAAGANVVLTRADDSYLDIEERIVIGRQAGADMFISIHNNWSSNAAARGPEVYYHAPNSPARTLAQLVYGEMIEGLAIPGRGVKTATFRVLRELPVPSILIECVFLSNATDEHLLADPGFREAIAQAIFAAVQRYWWSQASTSASP